MKRERKNIRLSNYDYTSEGWYFVTICTKDRECFFGDIVDNEMIYSEIGNQALKFWNEIPDHFSNVVLDEYQIMPNHIHGLVGIFGICRTLHATSPQHATPLRRRQKMKRWPQYPLKKDLCLQLCDHSNPP